MDISFTIVPLNTIAQWAMPILYYVVAPFCFPYIWGKKTTLREQRGPSRRGSLCPPIDSIKLATPLKFSPYRQVNLGQMFGPDE